MEWYQDPMTRDLVLALKNCIKAHGHITENHTSINSAVKRIYGVIKADRKGHYDNSRLEFSKNLRKPLHS